MSDKLFFLKNNVKIHICLHPNCLRLVTLFIDSLKFTQFNDPETTNCLNLCGEWTQYKSFKCVKVIEKKATEEEALLNCTRSEATSDLLSIHSKEEQEFISSLLLQFNNISNNAWIGLKYRNSSYKWTDGTDTNFTNWAEDAIKDGTDPCVQMSLIKTTLGKWTDEACRKTALIVCQKKPVLNLNLLRESIEKLERRVNSILPIGFLYTQLPEQSSPEKLWPDMKWSEVTEQYSGLFFRAEGNVTEPFGQIQYANQSVISTISYASYSNRVSSPGTYRLLKAGKEHWVQMNDTNGIQGLQLFTTSGEVRPINTAIKIWKRIQ